MVNDMAKGIKISDMSRDFAMKSKDVIEEFKTVNIEKTTGGTVSDDAPTNRPLHSCVLSVASGKAER